MAARTIDNVKLTYYPYQALCGSNPCAKSSTCCNLSKESHYAAINIGAMGEIVTISYKGKSTRVKILDRGGGVPMGFERWADISPAAWSDLTSAAPGVLTGATMAIGGGSIKDKLSQLPMGTRKGSESKPYKPSGDLPAPSDVAKGPPNWGACKVKNLERWKGAARSWIDEIQLDYGQEAFEAGVGRIKEAMAKDCPGGNDCFYSHEACEIAATVYAIEWDATLFGSSADSPTCLGGCGKSGRTTAVPDNNVFGSIEEAVGAIATALWFVINPANWAKVGMYALGVLLLVLALVLLYLFSKR